jgi:hypothetical protein
MASGEERIHFTLLVPGTQPDLDAWRRALAAQELELSGEELSGKALPFSAGVEWVANDGRFGEAFSFGTASADEVRAIDAAPGALVLMVPADLHRERAGVAALGRALAASGALALRFEESKAGYPVQRWLELVEGTDPWSLYRAAVVMLSGEGEAQTRGMHVFSLPDAHVALEGAFDSAAAHELLSVFNMYQLVEDPLLLSGHTFAPDAQTPKRVLRRSPDALYPGGHACHNPFGVWRLGPRGGKGEGAPPDPSPVIIPPLVAILMNLEGKARRPLTREEVEDVTRRAPAIAMAHRDARDLERRRGYADIDPERAWEEWQIVRGER